MKALLLAAGYATRLRPLTETVPKPLLPVAGRPMADWILDKLDACPEVDSVHLVTNGVYAEAFEQWAASREVVVHNDHTRTNETRLGAIGDVAFVLESGALADGPLLVIAADNLFDFSLEAYVGFWRSKPRGSAIAIHQLADASLAPLYGVVELDAEDRVVGLEEKPSAPRSDLVSTATYLFAAEHVPLIERYLREGNLPDPPGKFLAWLCEREPVYGFRFREAWLDIGELSQLHEADSRYRERAGLAPRPVYSLEL